MWLTVGTSGAAIGVTGAGTFNLTGGTATMNGTLYLSKNGGTGTVNLSGGNLNVATASEYVGYSGPGAFNQTGGVNSANYIEISASQYSMSNSAVLELDVTRPPSD